MLYGNSATGDEAFRIACACMRHSNTGRGPVGSLNKGFFLAERPDDSHILCDDCV